MSYYEIRPIVLAQLAQVAIAEAASDNRKFETTNEIINAALELEDAMFEEVAHHPRRSNYPEGKYTG